jgi:hypothetical protein
VRRLRAALRWLDPWAASLLGVLVALGVVILLATPGPWQSVVGDRPPVQAAPSRPADIAVFVQGGRGARCTGVLWLHAEYERPSLTACVLAPPTLGLVAGGGYAPVDRLVGDIGPGRAAAALGASLDVRMDAWVVMTREALRVAVPTMFPDGEQLAQRRESRRATAAWGGVGGVLRAWPLQYETLAEALPKAPFGTLNIVGFSNYVLGFGFVKSDLDLQEATSLAQLLRDLEPGQVRVRAVPAVLEQSREARAWRVDAAALERLRASLAFGVRPPAGLPRVERRRVSTTVVVAAPPAGAAGGAYVDELRRRLRASAGASVRVETVRTPAGGSLAGAVSRRLDQGRPLAVVIAAALPPTVEPATDVAAQIGAAAAVLRARAQPGLVCAPALPAAGEAAELEALLREGILPVAPAPPAMATAVVWDAGTARVVARANAATLVRACWPRALAPSLVSTRQGFSYAAARGAEVAVVGPDAVRAESTAARLRIYGFAAQAATGARWTPPLLVRAVYYRAAGRRAAFALAGDLALPPAAVLAEPEAPAPVALGLVR